MFITMEDSERTLSWRVRAWLDSVKWRRDEADKDLRANFEYLAREHTQTLALTQTDGHATELRAEVIERISALVKGATLVVLETASRLHDGPEMNEALAVFARAVERIAIESGAAVCVVRHVSKQAARDHVTDSYAGRGGGALSDAARSVLVMTRGAKQTDEDDDASPNAPVRLTHAKSTHAPNGAPISWKPIECEHGVYLQSLSYGEATKDDADRLHSHLRTLGAEGITKTDLHKQKNVAGLSRRRAKAAIDALLNERPPRARADRDKRKGQDAIVYRAAGVYGCHHTRDGGCCASCRVEQQRAEAVPGCR